MRKYLCLMPVLFILLALTGCQDELPMTSAPRPEVGGEDLACAMAHGGPGIIPPQAHPNGKSYGEWSELWWQWMASAPALPDQNPVLDSTGDLVDYNQSGQVWFVAGSMDAGVVREATIPPGKKLFICLTGCASSTYCGEGETEEELRASAAACADPIEITEFSVDGTEIPIGPEFRIQSEGMFSVTVPEDNVFDFWGCDPAAAGTYYPLVADGYYVMLAPLSVGDHTIVIDWGYMGAVFEMTLHLHVTPH